MKIKIFFKYCIFIFFVKKFKIFSFIQFIIFYSLNYWKQFVYFIDNKLHEMKKQILFFAGEVLKI